MLYFYLSMLDSPEEKQKIELLYTKYKGVMHRTAFHILQDDFLAEDAVHHTFIKIIKRLDAIQEISCPQTLSFCVISCRRVALDMKRNEHKEKFINYEDILDEISGKVNIEDEILLKIDMEIIVDKVMRLPDIYRDVFYLYYSNEFSLPQIADMLDISNENAKKRLQRARQKLFSMLQVEVAIR